MTACWVSAQRLPDGEIPPPPVTGLLDGQGVLGKNSTAQRRIVELLQTLEREHGYRMYVVLERSLIASNPSDMASNYQQEWLPDGGGMVFFFESDTKKMGFGRHFGPSEGMVAEIPGVPAYGLVEIISNSLADAGSEVMTEDYVEKLVTGIVTNLNAYFTKKEAPVTGGRSLRLALVTIGSLSLLALCGMGLGWLMGKADKKQTETRVFPMVNIPERLGAPYGGGGGASGFFGISQK